MNKRVFCNDWLTLSNECLEVNQQQSSCCLAEKTGINTQENPTVVETKISGKRLLSVAHHDTLAVEIMPRDHGLQCVQESHSTRYIQGKLHSLRLIHNKV